MHISLNNCSYIFRMLNHLTYFKMLIHKHIKQRLQNLLLLFHLNLLESINIMGLMPFLFLLFFYACFDILSGFQYYDFYSSPWVTKFFADPKEKITLSEQPRLQDLVYWLINSWSDLFCFSQGNSNLNHFFIVSFSIVK